MRCLLRTVLRTRQIDFNRAWRVSSDRSSILRRHPARFLRFRPLPSRFRPLALVLDARCLIGASRAQSNFVLRPFFLDDVRARSIGVTMRNLIYLWSNFLIRNLRQVLRTENALDRC